MQCILKTVGVHAETKNIFLIPIIAFIIGILWFLLFRKRYIGKEGTLLFLVPGILYGFLLFYQ